MEERVLITGGCGSIGWKIAKRLSQNSYNENFDGLVKVIVVDIDEIETFMKMQENMPIIFKIGDVKDPSSLKRIFDEVKPTTVYHAAAMKHVVVCEDNPLEAEKVNVLGTKNVVDACIDHGVEKMILISTDKAANPSNVMGRTKSRAEEIVMTSNADGKTKFSCVRFGNVANSRGSVIPIFVKNILNQRPLIITDENVTRFFMKIDDAVDLILKSTKMMNGGEIFILKMKSISLKDLLDVAVKKYKEKYSSMEPEIRTIGLLKGEKLHEDLINEKEAGMVFETNDMYIVSSKDIGYAKKAEINGYSSKDAVRMSKNEIEHLITVCMQEMARQW